jgi:hypothetical protein
VANQKIVLYQCGTPQPTVAGANITIPVPIKSVTIGDTTSVPYLELLGVTDKITYAADGTGAFVVSACLQDKIPDVNAVNASLAISQIQSTDVFFNFMSPEGNATNSIVFLATADPGVLSVSIVQLFPLGFLTKFASLQRAVYVSFTAAFFNLESKGNDISNNLVSNFNCLTSTVKNQSSQSTQPSVAVVQFNAPSEYNNNTASWQINAFIFESDYISAAGGKILIPSSGTVDKSSPAGPTYSYTTAKDFQNNLNDADILIDETFSDTNISTVYTSLGFSDSSSFKFIKNKQIYMSNKISTDSGTTGNDLFAQFNYLFLIMRYN